MCTVTYIPTKKSIFLTSNRDEKNWRTDAYAPVIYSFRSGKIVFPKDADAGGTWIAAHENGNVVIFLNGACKAHTPSPPYRKSRGLVLLGIIDHASPPDSFLDADITDIEPFTAIIRDNNKLYECRWDGTKKCHKEIDPHISHIWSSVTLYDDETIKKRKMWFDDWISVNKTPSRDDILHFHQFTGDGDSHTDLLMNRNGKVFTVSITSIEISGSEITMTYLDLKNDQQYSEHISFESSITGR
jgi:hypothetical protein